MSTVFLKNQSINLTFIVALCVSNFEFLTVIKMRTQLTNVYGIGVGGSGSQVDVRTVDRTRTEANAGKPGKIF